MAIGQTTLHLGRADHGRPLTAEEFAGASYDEPWKYERVDGSLVVMFPDSEAHDGISEPWRDRLGMYRLTHPEIVEQVVSEAWLLVPDLTDRIGDIGVYLLPTDGSTPPSRPGRVPELMFEVVSPEPKDRRRDYVEKKAEYHAVGVREYVVIDRFERKVTVFTHDPDGYRERVLTGQGVHETPLLPGFRVPLDDVF
jgi:Uma2 family endonuclease